MTKFLIQNLDSFADDAKEYLVSSRKLQGLYRRLNVNHFPVITLRDAKIKRMIYRKKYGFRSSIFKIPMWPYPPVKF